MRESWSGRRWSRIFKPDARAEVEDELRFHLEQRERDNIARGMDPELARAAALERLGDLNAIRSECTNLLTAERRSEARREWLTFSWLDFKLGFRMLAKYPGLTIVGGVAIAFAIMVGAASFEFMIKVARPSLGLPDGDRIVALRLWDASQSELEERALHDFTVWRAQAKSIEHIGAYRTVERNLIGSDRRAVPVTAAEMTATGFRVAGEAPLLGRPLVEEDERAGAPAVVVIRESVWRTRFDRDPDIIGRVVRLGDEQHTVVGVMPEDFAFPLYHSAWIPFRVNAAGYPPREGPGVSSFGRLARGSTLEQAQAELTALGARAAAESPRTHRHLQPQVLSYAYSFFEAEPIMASYFINSFMALFMLLIYANVALLMFGRAATREGEIVVRNALGASRGRILTQLFSEALVLGAVGAAIGLFVARLGVGWAFSFLDGNSVELPFWYREQLSPLTVVYAVGLTLVAAVVAGVVPGLKATRGLGTQLRAASAGGGGLRFGGLWTVIIVTQVAFTVAFFPALIAVGVTTVKARAVDLGVAAEQYLALRLDRDDAQSGAAGDTRGLGSIYEELKRRVAAEPGVRGVTYAHEFPGQYHPEPAIEVEGVPTVLPSGVQLRVQRATVDIDFMDVMGASIQVGRGFHSADLTSAAGVVIVNETFRRVVLGGRSPIGRRLRYLRDADDGRESEPSPWYEIVGVVKDLAMWVDAEAVGQPGLYHPLSLAGAGTLGMAIHVERDPLSFAPRLRTIATQVDPTLRVQEIKPLDQIAGEYLDAVTFWFRILVVAGSIALLLSLAGIYSIMSFTVARRTREIGIRVALGSGRERILAAMFSRSFFQIGLGVALGVGVLLLFMIGREANAGWAQLAKELGLVAAYATVMSGVCLLACVVPARRALRVQPIDALRADG